MTYNSNRCWPPTWLWRSGTDNTDPKGEVDILRDVIPFGVEPCPKDTIAIVNQEIIQAKAIIAVSAVRLTEEEPPKPPPDEDEPNPPIKEPPTEEPPVEEPPPKNS